MKSFHQKMKEAAETTVFVTNVKDLRVDANLSQLRSSLVAQYGPVVMCRRHQYDGRHRTPYPPALVRFQNARDAASMFNVDSLLRVDSKSVRLPCPIGHRGFILVQPYRYVNEIAKEEMTSPIIDVSATRMSFGHWYPPRKDEESGAWLEVETAKERPPTESSHEDQDFPGFAEIFARMLLRRSISRESATVQIDLVQREVRIIHAGTNVETVREIMTFRFKQLESPMRLCRDKSGAPSIVFSLKYPPKLEREQLCLPYFDTKTFRRITWAGVEAETFGKCKGCKISLEEATVLALQQHDKYNDLKSFGVLNLDYSHDVESQFIGWEQEHLWDDMIVSVHSVRLRK